MTTRYAEATGVSVEKTQSELKKVLREYRADMITIGESRTGAMVGFKLGEKLMRFNLPMPAAGDDSIKYTASKRWMRSPPEVARALDQAGRSRWRALLLAIRAKLEAVAIGITTIEEEFLSHIVLPSGRTVGETVIPEVQAALEGRPESPRLGLRDEREH
jgi:hypothetical protein